MSTHCEEWDSWNVERQCESRIRDKDGEYHRCQQNAGSRHRNQHTHHHGVREAVVWRYDVKNPGKYYGPDDGSWADT